MYAKGVLSVTRARLKLLGLQYRRREELMRERLAERVRQQVLDEAAADLNVHRQMCPSTGRQERLQTLLFIFYTLSVASASTHVTRSTVN